MGNKIVEALAKVTTSSQEITNDILILQFKVVNAFLIGDPNIKSEPWALVDTGLENSDEYILQTCEKRFGKVRRPQSIILTHGHFDHVGALDKLIKAWNVPVYIHPLEIDYITGKKDYPLGDSDVDEGLVAKMSPTFPHTSIDIGFHAVPLPPDGAVPGMPGWRWIHTPGHTDGHISLFRERGRVLIVGDAFSTIKQESLISVITQDEKISGPPKYLTTDWDAAEKSVRLLKDLNPSIIIPSHGQPMKGETLAEHLDYLVNNFDEIAIPREGKYVDR